MLMKLQITWGVIMALNVYKPTENGAARGMPGFWKWYRNVDDAQIFID